MNNNQNLTLTVEQAAQLLGIGRSTAYELVHGGDIPSLRLGRRIVVPVAKIADRLGASPEHVTRAIHDLLDDTPAPAPASTDPMPDTVEAPEEVPVEKEPVPDPAIAPVKDTDQTPFTPVAQRLFE